MTTINVTLGNQWVLSVYTCSTSYCMYMYYAIGEGTPRATFWVELIVLVTTHVVD